MIKKAYWPLFIIVVISGFLLLSRLNRDLFWDWDECLYTVYAREMARTGNFLANQWNGYIDLQKPPLLAWILQIPYLFAKNEFAPRIFSVFAGLSLVSAIYIFSKKYFSQKIALISSLLLFVSIIFVTYVQKVNTDIGFSFLIFLGVWLWISSYKHRNHSYFAGFVFAIAVMIKGLSVIQFLIPIFFSIFLNPKKEKFINYFRMLLVFTIALIPWHLLTYLKYKQDFLQIYFYENILQRSQNPIEFHYGGKFFYLEQLYKEFFPWIFSVFILPIYYVVKIKRYTRLKAVLKELKNKKTIFTVGLLIILPLIALTRIKTKIAWYAIPIYPFLTIFIAYNLDMLLKRIRINFVSWLIILLLVFVSFKTLYRETNFKESKSIIPPRQEIAIKARAYPQKELYYLVAKTERIAKALLDQSPNLQIRSTFVYGGNPCAVYYSDKKVHYYYSTEEFEKELNKPNRLYLLENGDLSLIQKPTAKILHQNKEFTLFTLQNRLLIQ